MLRNRMLVVCALLVAGAVSVAAQSQNPHVDRIRIGGTVQLAKITKKVEPVYPAEAKKAGISGTVVLHAVIAQDGTVKQLDYVSGPRELTDSAMVAARQWEYKPTLLNGQPVEVDTTINVDYEPGSGESGGSSADAHEAGAAQGQTQNGFTVQGGDHPFTRPMRIEPQLKADLEELFQVMHFDNMMTRMLASDFEPVEAKINAALPNQPSAKAIVKEFFDRVIAIGESPEMKDSMMLIYAKYLTDGQVKEAVEFYKTAAGQQMLVTQVKMYDDAKKAGERIFTQNIPEILQDMCREHPELQGRMKACK